MAPAELEGLLLDHPDIADVCVVGAPDDYSGELPFAFIALKEEARARIAKDAAQEQQIRDAIMKVRSSPRPPLSLNCAQKEC